MAMINRIRCVGVLVCLACAAFLLPMEGQAQSATLEAVAVSVRGETGSSTTRIDIYSQIPRSSLRFISTGSGFAARYDLAVNIYRLDERNRKRGLVQTAVWEQTVSAETYAATQSDRTFDRSARSVELAPGRYRFEIRMEDRNSGEAQTRELAVNVRDLSQPVAVSDLILLEKYDPVRGTITPDVAGKLTTDSRSLSLFYEVYARQAHRIRVTRELVRIAGDTRPGGIRAIFGLGGRNDEGEITYSKIEPAPLKAGRNPSIVEIPLSGLEAGKYLVRVRAEDEAGRLLDVVDKPFSVEWSGLDQHIRDLDQAVDQLAYIAKGKDLKYIRAGKTESERIARFKAFWEKRDPTPGTPRNERMEEYYFRIAYANNRFPGLLAGWKTDRGHVAILFGEPDRIERHTSEANPFEVWFYERIGRRFIFVDRTGRGDYVLKEPVWDDRTTIR